MADDQNQQQSNYLDSLNRVFDSGKRVYGKGKQVLDVEKDTKRVASLVKNLSGGGWALGTVLFLFFATLGVVIFAGAPGGVAGGDLNNNPAASSSASLGGSPGPTLAPGQKPSEVFYCQWQGSWANQSYNAGIIAKDGCAPTSMAMIFSSYGVTKTPGDMATLFHQNGWDWSAGSGHVGTNPWAVTQTWLNSLGFQRAQTDIVNSTGGTSLSSQSLQLIKNYTDAGWLLYTALYWPKISGGHQIVIEDADPTAGTVTIRDSNSCPNGIYTISVSGYSSWYLITPIRIK